MTHHDIGEPFAPRTPNLIGRAGVKKKIIESIKNADKNSFVYYLTGPGGIGKTRLLEEIGVIRNSNEAGAFRWSGIIDLYHNQFHSPSGLRFGIVEGLDPENEYFQEYRKLRAEFEKKRASGIVGKALEILREELDKIFLSEYEAMSNKHRLVLSIDTLELIQYESDIVQKICRVEDVDTVIKNWLLDLLPKLPNTVTLMAGRVRKKIQAEFARKYSSSGLDFEAKKIGAFTKTEVKEYFKVMRKLKPELDGILTADVQEQVIGLTRGLPINLALVIDLALHDDGGLGQILPVNPTEVSQAELGKILVRRLLNLPPPYGQIMYYLAMARKGLDAKLLSHLSGKEWGSEESEKKLAEIQSFAFVKSREQDGERQLFLHDEVYDLFDYYFREDPTFGRQFRPIADYYHHRLEALQLELDGAKDVERRNYLLGQIESVKLALVYYEHHINPDRGYHRYFARWDEEAIKGHEIGFDMRLRDESLRFMDRYTDQKSEFYDPRIADQVDRPDIDLDDAVRWVRRHLIRGQFSVADAVAERVKKSEHPNFAWRSVSDDIYKAALLSAQGEAQIFSGSGKKALETSQEAVDHLTGDKTWSEDQAWWRSRILGRTYATIGYTYRTIGQYGPALDNYTRALTFLRADSVKDERANVINNLAYLLALLGRVDEASFHANQALEIREELGKRQPIALSINTLGQIFVYQEHVMWGQQECQRALELSLELGDPRSIGLCHIGVGFALRKRGEQWKLGQRIYTPEQAYKFFEESESHFLKAFEIFSPMNVNEPIRRWEAMNELGSLYCDWGWLDWWMGEKNESLIKYYKSINYHKEALFIATKEKLEFQEMDANDDLAQTYYDMAFFMAQTKKLPKSKEYQELGYERLDAILSKIPKSSQLGKGRYHQVKSDTNVAHLLALGKAHHRWAVWNFRAVGLSDVLPGEREAYMDHALLHSATAVAYLEKFSPTSFALKTVLKYFSDHLRKADADIDWIHERLRKIEDDLNVDLKIMHKNVDLMIGMIP